MGRNSYALGSFFPKNLIAVWKGSLDELMVPTIIPVLNEKLYWPTVLDLPKSQKYKIKKP